MPPQLYKILHRVNTNKHPHDQRNCKLNQVTQNILIKLRHFLRFSGRGPKDFWKTVEEESSYEMMNKGGNYLVLHHINNCD